jgi:transcriptional regulator with XRE-family HTH domain
MIGDRLKHFRKQNQLTQEAMADLICVSQSWYSKLESKSEGFTVELIHRIAKVLKIDASQLLNANMQAPRYGK